MAVESQGLKRELNLLDSTLIVIGSMVGSGIFIVSSDIGRQMGSPAWMMGLWLATGIITLMAALSYGELAGMMPKAGGQYVYLREAYNPMTGFLFGWTTFLVIQTGTIAAVAVAFAKYTGVLIPWISESNHLVQLGRFHISSNQVLAVCSVLFLTWMNSRGVKTGKLVQLVFTVTKIAALALLILLCVFVGRNPAALQANFSHFFQQPFQVRLDSGQVLKTMLSGPAVWLAAGGAMVGSLFSSDAWNNITFTAGEVRNPKRNIPLSLFLGTLTVTVLYILANLGYLMVLPLAGHPVTGAGLNDAMQRGIMFASDDRVATAAMGIILGQAAVLLMAMLIMISTFGCNNGLIMAGARVYYAMADDKLFFPRAAKLNRESVPAFSLWVQGIWTSVLCLSGGYGALLDYVIFAVLIFYILTVGAVFVLRVKNPGLERPYSAWGYPVVPALYILCASAIAADLLFVKWETSRWGALIVLLGIPVYFLSARFFAGNLKAESQKNTD